MAKEENGLASTFFKSIMKKEFLLLIFTGIYTALLAIVISGFIKPETNVFQILFQLPTIVFIAVVMFLVVFAGFTIVLILADVINYIISKLK